MTSPHSADERWERRLERERAARRQAERLAEQGMRDLWQANQDLQEKVRHRTAALDRSLAVAAHLSRARLTLLAGLVHDAVSSTGGSPRDAATLEVWAGRLSADPEPPSVETEATSPRDAVAELVARYQTAAARRAVLLVPSASAGGEVAAPWSRLIAAAHAVLECVVTVSVPGSLHLEVSTTGDRVTVTIDDAGPPLAAGTELPGAGGDSPAASAWLSCIAVGGRNVGLAVAQQVSADGGLSMTVRPGPLGGVRVALSAPASG